MNQFGVHYIYIWKCHNIAPYVSIICYQSVLEKTNEGHEGKTDPSWGLVLIGVGT
jgi:hypothetical protein